MYRCKYPVDGLPFHIDMDLKIRMENKICSSLLLYFIKTIINRNFVEE